MLVQIAGREVKTLESILDGLARVPGQKHMICPGIQVFSSRYLLRWSGESQPASLALVDITVKRKGIRVIAPTQM